MKRLIVYLIFLILFISVFDCEAQSFYAKRYRTPEYKKAIQFCITGSRANPNDPSKSVMYRSRRFLWWRIK